MCRMPEKTTSREWDTSLREDTTVDDRPHATSLRTRPLRRVARPRPPVHTHIHTHTQQIACIWTARLQSAAQWHGTNAHTAADEGRQQLQQAPSRLKHGQRQRIPCRMQPGILTTATDASRTAMIHDLIASEPGGRSTRSKCTAQNKESAHTLQNTLPSIPTPSPPPFPLPSHATTPNPSPSMTKLGGTPRPAVARQVHMVTHRSAWCNAAASQLQVVLAAAAVGPFGGEGGGMNDGGINLRSHRMAETNCLLAVAWRGALAR